MQVVFFVSPEFESCERQNFQAGLVLRLRSQQAECCIRPVNLEIKVGALNWSEFQNVLANCRIYDAIVIGIHGKIDEKLAKAIAGVVTVADGVPVIAAVVEPEFLTQQKLAENGVIIHVDMAGPRQTLAIVLSKIGMLNYTAAKELNFGVLRLELNSERAFVGQHQLYLPRREQAVLFALARHASTGRYLTKAELSKLVYGIESEKYGDTVESHVSKLVARINHAQPGAADCLLRKRFLGYRLDADFCKKSADVRQDADRDRSGSDSDSEDKAAYPSAFTNRGPASSWVPR